LKKVRSSIVSFIFVLCSVCACSSNDCDGGKKFRMAERIAVETKQEEELVIAEKEKKDVHFIAEKYSITEENLNRVIKIVIEDDIWFENENSKFYPYMNQDIEYEYYYSEKREHIRYPDTIYILPLIGPDNSLSHLYHVMELNIFDGRLIIPDNRYAFIGQQDLDGLKAAYIPEVTGRGTVSIGARRKPLYDADEEDIKEAKKCISDMLNRERMEGQTSNREDIYIRNFYKDSIDTIMSYTVEGEQYYCYVDLNGGRYYKPFTVEEYGREYFNQVMECSFPLYE